MTMLAQPDSESPTPYQLLPRLTDEEYGALKADIAENGVRVPIDVDENGQVLDGHHRSWITADLGIDCPRRVVTGLTDEQKRTHAIAVNVHRRNLSREQRRELVGRLRSDGMSTRSIAAAVGISHETARKDAGVNSLTPASVTGADGKSYPASRPSSTQSADTASSGPPAVPDGTRVGPSTDTDEMPSAPEPGARTAPARDATTGDPFGSPAESHPVRDGNDIAADSPEPQPYPSPFIAGGAAVDDPDGPDWDHGEGDAAESTPVDITETPQPTSPLSDADRQWLSTMNATMPEETKAMVAELHRRLGMINLVVEACRFVVEAAHRAPAATVAEIAATERNRIDGTLHQRGRLLAVLPRASSYLAELVELLTGREGQ